MNPKKYNVSYPTSILIKKHLCIYNSANVEHFFLNAITYKMVINKFEAFEASH